MHFLTFLSIVSTASAATTGRPASKMPRGDMGDITCDKNHMVQGRATDDDLGEGKDTLRNGGTAHVDYTHCARVSCSNNAAVWWCDNSNKDFDVDTPEFVPYIDAIMSKCGESGLYSTIAASGVADNSDGWSIEIGFNEC